MINQFNDVEVRETAVIYKSNLEQIKEFYKIDPNIAGELAISIIEVALSGQMSTDNGFVKAALANYKDVANKNGVKYDKRVEAKREARIEKLQLRKIASLYLMGVSQKEIAKATGKGESTVSENLSLIRSEFPELLANNSVNSEISSELGEFDNTSENLPNSENSEELGEFEDLQRNSENSENSDHVNDNVNVNENVNVNDNVSRVSSNEETLPSISRQALSQMGATYKDLGNGVIETATGKKMKLDFKYDF